MTTLVRLSPTVRDMQGLSPYSNVYTGSPSPTRKSKQEQSQSTVSLTNDHPQQAPRWTNTGSPGAKHANDDAPFLLYDHSKGRFTGPNTEQCMWMFERYKVKKVTYREPFLICSTLTPPVPVPLTIGGMPAIFSPPDYDEFSVAHDDVYANPRVPDPCPLVTWPVGQFPVKSHMISIIQAMSSIASIRKIHFLRNGMIIELKFGDGRVYAERSLPGVIGKKGTRYYHNSESLFSKMHEYTRERVLDPLQYLIGTAPGTGTSLQDTTDYLMNTSLITPGIRVSSGPLMSTGQWATTTMSTTCGIRLRKGPRTCVTVANHGFLQSDEVYHPSATGSKVGDIVDRYPELDVALMKMAPSEASKFSNSSYFQAEPPLRLATIESAVKSNGWYEVDGMSTGLLSLFFYSRSMEEPVRPPNHPLIPVSKWIEQSTHRIFGSSNQVLREGVCGAPIVNVDNGEVVGFFHRATGTWMESAGLDDLIAEGWEVV